MVGGSCGADCGGVDGGLATGLVAVGSVAGPSGGAYAATWRGTGPLVVALLATRPALVGAAYELVSYISREPRGSAEVQ